MYSVVCNYSNIRKTSMIVIQNMDIRQEMFYLQWSPKLPSISVHSLHCSIWYILRYTYKCFSALTSRVSDCTSHSNLNYPPGCTSSHLKESLADKNHKSKLNHDGLLNLHHCYSSQIRKDLAVRKISKRDASSHLTLGSWSASVWGFPTFGDSSYSRTVVRFYWAWLGSTLGRCHASELKRLYDLFS